MRLWEPHTLPARQAPQPTFLKRKLSLREAQSLPSTHGTPRVPDPKPRPRHPLQAGIGENAVTFTNQEDSKRHRVSCPQDGKGNVNSEAASRGGECASLPRKSVKAIEEMAALMVRASILTEGDPLASQPYRAHGVVSEAAGISNKNARGPVYAGLGDGEADSSVFYGFTRLEPAVPTARFIVK